MSALTAPQQRALEIVRDHPECGGAQFARLMWPEAVAKRHRAIWGLQRSAGAFLSRLADKGLVRWVPKPHSYTPVYAITEAGLEALDGN